MIISLFHEEIENISLLMYIKLYLMTKDDILQLDRRRVPRGKPTGGLNSIFHVWEHVYHTPAEIKSPQSLTFPTVPNKIIYTTGNTQGKAAIK